MRVFQSVRFDLHVDLNLRHLWIGVWWEHDENQGWLWVCLLPFVCIQMNWRTRKLLDYRKEVQKKKKRPLDWLEEAPPEVKSVVQDALAFERKQKDELIEKITSNERNQFKVEYLLTLSVEELNGLSALASEGDAA